MLEIKTFTKPLYAFITLNVLLNISFFNNNDLLAKPQHGVVSIKRPAIPSLDEMGGTWIPMKDVENPPAVHNFHDMLIIGYDLTSFSCNPGYFLWHSKPSKIYPPVRLLVGGTEYQATDCRWYPYSALRRNLNCNGLAVETAIRMVNEQNGILSRVVISNPSKKDMSSSVALQLPGYIDNDGITALSPQTITQNNSSGIVSTDYITATGPVQKPENITVSGGAVNYNWNIKLPPGGKLVIEFVSGHAKKQDISAAINQVSNWRGNFNQEFEAFKQCWEQRWFDAFTPGNKHFSGSLPVLTTKNTELARNYYMGVVTMLALERTQFSIYPRSFVTSGERGPGTQYFWDASMQATVWALLEPVGMKVTMRRWLVQNVRRGVVINLNNAKGFDKTKADSISGYAFTACTIFKTVFDYIKVSGDTSFIDEKLENGKTVIERLEEIATDWKTLVLPDSKLANYGENKNLLECAPEYIHRVASANAQNVLMMRQTAFLYELKNNLIKANELRDEANTFLPSVLELYKAGDGVWNGLHKDGKKVELRHCVDYIYVGDALTNDLSPKMKQEMTDFVKKELFMAHWLRAMSQKDEAAKRSDRPDHGPMGAYDGWIPLTVGTMWRLGYPKEAFNFYCSTAAVTNEGPFAQAHEFYGKSRADFDAPIRIAYRKGCLKECISGTAFTDVVINTFFGFSPSISGDELIDDAKIARPFTGSLTGVRYKNKLYNLVAGNNGIAIQNKN